MGNCIRTHAAHDGSEESDEIRLHARGSTSIMPPREPAREPSQEPPQPPRPRPSPPRPPPVGVSPPRPSTPVQAYQRLFRRPNLPSLRAPTRSSANTPTGSTSTLLQPVRDPRPDLDCNKNELLGILQNMASYLDDRNQPITLVGAGGALQMLRDRPFRRHDFYYFSTDLTHGQWTSLELAAAVAVSQQRRSKLTPDWMAGRAALFVSWEAKQTATREAVDEGSEYFFSRPGLRILCAPPEYALTRKLDVGSRLDDRDERDDLCANLRLAMAKHNKTKVLSTEIVAWGERYDILVNVPLMINVIIQRGFVHQIKLVRVGPRIYKISRQGAISALDNPLVPHRSAAP